MLNFNSLDKLLNKLHINEKFAAQIREILPSELAPHLSNVLLQDDRAVLWTTSPAWGSRLRFFLPSLYKKFPHIKSIRVSILPQTHEHFITTESLSIRTMSPENSHQLLELAAQVSTPNLQAVLIKLAAHSKI